MWTPRRIALFLIGLFGSLAAYYGYSQFLGTLNGLPPLPEEYLVVMNKDCPLPDLGRDTETNRRLRLAFGDECIETTYPLKIDVRAKGMLLAANEFQIEADGKVQLWPASIAAFGKNRTTADEIQEIHTLHADRVFLEFDQPVKNFAEMGSHKLIAIQLFSDAQLDYPDPRRGLIHVVSNRKTSSKDDDIILRTPGPLFYRESPIPNSPIPHLWTDAPIEVIDKQNLQRNESGELMAGMPTVLAEGLKVYLAIEPEPDPKDPTPPANRRKPGTITGVDRVWLDKNVLMNFWVDADSNFFSTSGKDKPLAKGNKPPEKSTTDASTQSEKSAPKALVRVETHGAFQYDLNSDRARFEIAPQLDPNLPNHVVATRYLRPDMKDMLACDHLDIQFKRKKGETTTGPESRKKDGDSPQKPSDEKESAKKADKRSEVDMEIEQVHAYGKLIALFSDSEQMQAWGNDLNYDAKKKETILRGGPMVAVKEVNFIQSLKLIINTVPGKDGRDSTQAKALGPGLIGIGEIDPLTGKHARQARWDELLTFSKDTLEGVELELLTFEKNASFWDHPAQQMLAGDVLKVWLIGGTPAKKSGEKESVPPKEAAKLAADASGTDKKPDPNRQKRPHRVDAIGRVAVDSRELTIRRSDYMTIYFQDVEALPEDPSKKKDPPKLEAKPKEELASKSPEAVAPKEPPLQPLPPPILSDGQGLIGGAVVRPGPLASSIPPKPVLYPPQTQLIGGSVMAGRRKAPLLLTAEKIKAYVFRAGNKVDLDRVFCDVGVHVHQDPSPTQIRGTDIFGHHLEMQHYPEGNDLLVVGQGPKDAELHFEKLSLKGMTVRIDQRGNRAEIKGAGSMRILSGTDLEGKALREPKWLTIFWRDQMEFRGSEKWAYFDGNVEAHQEPSKLLCQNMQVELDREVYLNQVGKEQTTDPNAKESAKIRQVVCDQTANAQGANGPKTEQPVFFEDTLFEADKLVRYQSIESRTLTMDNQKSAVHATGPGRVRILQAGAKDPNAPVDPKQPRKKEDQEMKLTIVDFDGNMVGNNKTPQAVFRGRIHVYNLPTEDPKYVLDPKKRLPYSAIYLFCDESLTVFGKKLANGKSAQEMIARGNSYVQSEDYRGRADEIKIDEAKDLIIFVGSTTNPATLSRVRAKGTPPELFQGQKITYNRRTGACDVVGGSGASIPN